MVGAMRHRRSLVAAEGCTEWGNADHLRQVADGSVGVVGRLDVTTFLGHPRSDALVSRLPACLTVLPVPSALMVSTALAVHRW